MRLKDLRNELKATLKQLADDREISDLQIDYWIKVAADSLRWKVLRAQGLEDQSRSGRYLRRFVVDILTDDQAVDKSCMRYIVLPENIYDFELDGAIDYMAYYSDGECKNCPPPFTRVTFGRTTPAASRGLYMDSDQAPSSYNPYFFRIASNLYLLGLEQSPSIAKVEVGLFTSLPDIRDIDPNQNLDLADELLIELRRIVTDNARVMLMLPTQDRQNTGSPEGLQENTFPKVASVNEPQPSQQQ